MSTKTKTTKAKSKKENLAALGLPALWERFQEGDGGDHQEPEQKVPRPAHRGGARRARRRARAGRGAAAPDAHQRARDAGARARDDAREKGRINVGPRKTRARDGEPLEVKILPLRLEVDVADKMDEAWRAKGIKNRMEFFRGAIGHYLAHLGARDAAALFTNAGTTGAGTRRNRRGVGRPTTASDAPCPRNLADIPSA